MKKDLKLNALDFLWKVVLASSAKMGPADPSSTLARVNRQTARPVCSGAHLAITRSPALYERLLLGRDLPHTFFHSPCLSFSHEGEMMKT
mmetsp:Transcript_27844/g.45318  ORF Transcript_27844/g.45318 Transcript_27844/m.45318 type:complete len:90 (+) Transcript_27844:2335-2604(+)